MGYNNNVVEFTTDTDDKTILNATITIGTLTAIIYPRPDGTFFFNFKEWLKPFLNSDNYLDLVNPEISGSNFDTLTYTGSGFVFLSVNFRITFTDTTNESTTKSLSFLAGVEQLDSYKRNETQTNTNITLLPLAPESNNTYYAKYWEGYPFDISFLQVSPENLEIENTTNLLDYTFNQKGQITRLFFSDGRTDESINDFLPISLGMNVLKWRNKFIRVQKEDVCKGKYFKWLNNYGGYSYWKFPDYYEENLSTSSIGELNKDFNNVPDTFSQVTQIGSTATPRLSVNSDILTSEEFNLLKTILTSPKVFLFVGEPFSRASANDWVEVKRLTNTHRLRNFKSQPNSVVVEFELPDLYTITL
jgi:hypothetical protein